MLPLLVLLGTIAGAWYLLIVRPQKDQQTRHGQLVERLQVGDHVLTVGGIYGRVVAVEGSSIVLELAPGLTSRIATDGIARIVHGGEASLPTPTHRPAQDAQHNPHESLDTAMQHHQHPDQHEQPQQHFAAPAYTAPQQPYAAPMPVAAPAQPQAAPSQHAMPPAQLPAPPAPGEQAVTLRAHVVGSSIPTFHPRPWGDVAPVNAPQPHQPPVQQDHRQPVPHGQQQYAAAPGQLPMPSLQPAQLQQQAPVQQPAIAIAPAPMPVHQPFAGQQQHAMPMQQQPMPMHPQAMPMQQHAMPVQAHAVPMQHAVAPLVEQSQPAQAPEPARRHSRAPQGMGSTLRLDDPSLSDTMMRARDERAGLADEYRKLTAPMVDVDQHYQQQQPQQPQPIAIPDGAVMVGHDPSGVPLFATPGSPVAHPIAQYPAPARVEGTSAMPRPVVQAPHGTVDPALQSGAFQRRTPYAPEGGVDTALANSTAAAHAAPQAVRQHEAHAGVS